MTDCDILSWNVQTHKHKIYYHMAVTSVSFYILSNISSLSSSLHPLLLCVLLPLQHSISPIYSDRQSLQAKDLHFLTTFSSSNNHWIMSGVMKHIVTWSYSFHYCYTNHQQCSQFSSVSPKA